METTLTMKEQKRIEIIERVFRGELTVADAALVVRIRIIAAVSAPSSLAFDTARKFKMTLVRFLGGQSCNLYAVAERIGSGTPA